MTGSEKASCLTGPMRAFENAIGDGELITGRLTAPYAAPAGMESYRGAHTGRGVLETISV